MGYTHYWQMPIDAPEDVADTALRDCAEIIKAKTRREPYDVVVVACLVAIKDRMGDNIKVRSDGEAEDWVDGIRLAEEVLGRKLKYPVEESEE